MHVKLNGKLGGKVPITREGKLIDIVRKFTVTNGKTFALKFKSKGQEKLADTLMKKNGTIDVSVEASEENNVLDVASVITNYHKNISIARVAH